MGSPKILEKFAQKRLCTHLDASNEDQAILYFALYINFAPDSAINQLSLILVRHPSEQAGEWSQRAQIWLGSIFSRDSRWSNWAEKMSVNSLSTLVRLTYLHVPINQDEGAVSRDSAEIARGAVLNALINRGGVEVHKVLLEMASEQLFYASALRFKELAHRIAETCCEIPKWTPNEIVKFEKTHITSVKNCSDLPCDLIGFVRYFF